MRLDEMLTRGRGREVIRDSTALTFGKKVPVCEVAEHWGDVKKWRELSRFCWRRPEHINVLEARTGVVTLSAMVKKDLLFGQRRLLISDSQVTIAVMTKGRSSSAALNYVARRHAAICLATSTKTYWRYVRTWRNVADGPSRGFGLGPAPHNGELPGIFHETDG
jgi:hypothetical protein